MIKTFEDFDRFIDSQLESHSPLLKILMRKSVLRYLIFLDRNQDYAQNRLDGENASRLFERVINACHNSGEISGYGAGLYSSRIGDQKKVGHKWRDIVFSIALEMR